MEEIVISKAIISKEGLAKGHFIPKSGYQLAVDGKTLAAWSAYVNASPVDLKLSEDHSKSIRSIIGKIKKGTAVIDGVHLRADIAFYPENVQLSERAKADPNLYPISAEPSWTGAPEDVEYNDEQSLAFIRTAGIDGASVVQKGAVTSGMLAEKPAGQINNNTEEIPMDDKLEENKDEDEKVEEAAKAVDEATKEVEVAKEDEKPDEVKAAFSALNAKVDALTALLEARLPKPVEKAAEKEGEALNANLAAKPNVNTAHMVLNAIESGVSEPVKKADSEYLKEARRYIKRL